METFSALMALCAGNSPVTCEFLPQRPLWRQCNETARTPLSGSCSIKTDGVITDLVSIYILVTPSSPMWELSFSRDVWTLMSCWKLSQYESTDLINLKGYHDLFIFRANFCLFQSNRSHYFLLNTWIKLKIWIILVLVQLFYQILLTTYRISDDTLCYYLQHWKIYDINGPSTPRLKRVQAVGIW